MDVYTVTIETWDARAASLSPGGRRYEHSMYQDGDGMWQRLSEPHCVAALYGMVLVAVQGHDERDVVDRIGREIGIPLDEPPVCAPYGLHVDLRNTWRIRAMDTSDDERYSYASDRPRIWASRLRVGSMVPVPSAAPEWGRDEG